MNDVKLRLKSEYLESCYDSWKAVLNRFETLLEVVSAQSPGSDDSLQKLIEDARAKVAAKKVELRQLYEANSKLLHQGFELHETTPVVIRLEINWSQIVRGAWAVAENKNASQSGEMTISCNNEPCAPDMSTPNSELFSNAIAGNNERSSANSPCLFGSIGSGLASGIIGGNTGSRSVLGMAPVASESSNGNGTASAEPYFTCFGLGDNNNGNNTNGGGLLETQSSGTFDSSWLPGWAGVDFAASLKEGESSNGPSMLSEMIFSGGNHSNHDTKSMPQATVCPTSPRSFSQIVQNESDKNAAFEWLFSCLKDWRSRQLLSVPFDLLLEKCVVHGDTSLWRALQGEKVSHLVAFVKQFPNVFSVSADDINVSLVMTPPAADASSKDGEYGSPPNGIDGKSDKQSITRSISYSSNHNGGTVNNTTPGTNGNLASSKQRRSGSLLEMDDFGNTSNSSHESASSNSMQSDDGTWQEVVKKVAKSSVGRPHQPCANDIRERIIDVLDLTSHGSNLAKLIAVEILRRAVKENAVPSDLTAESIDKLRAYLPNALSSARGKMARPKPCLPPEHADWTYKTKLCVQFATTRQCSMATSCRFAHGLAELRPKRRAEYCSYWKKSGSCPRRDSCQYAHSPEELGQYVDMIRPQVETMASAPARPTLSIQPATMSVSLNQACNVSPTSLSNDSYDLCWLCKGQRKGSLTKQLKCGHKYHAQCLSKHQKKQHNGTVDVSAAFMADDTTCPKCRTIAIATVAVNV